MNPIMTPSQVRNEASRITAAVATHWNTCGYRQTRSHWVGGDHTTRVLLTTHTPGARGVTEKVWHRTKIRSGTNSEHIVAVHHDWPEKVAALGLGTVAGMFTLEATPLVDGIKAGEQVFSARWVEQAAGFSLNVTSGLLYRRDGLNWIHASSLTGARSQASRLAKAAAAAHAAKRDERRARLLARISCRPVTAAAVKAVGACDAGIRNWCARHGIDPDGTVDLAVLGRDFEARPFAISIARQLLRQVRA